MPQTRPVLEECNVAIGGCTGLWYIVNLYPVQSSSAISLDLVMSILVTGGAGYIGSHTVVELIRNGYSVIIVDNLINSLFDAVARIEFIVQQHVPFYDVDLKDTDSLAQVFSANKIDSVIHFAALKAVGESTKIPLQYYDNNVNGTILLLQVMERFNVKDIVFSSLATVYGDVTRFGDDSMIPIPEHCPNDPTNPYGKTKYTIEQILKDVHASDPKAWKTAILRYFNPIGAHSLGLLGEDPLGIPNNLLPYLAQVAIGRRDKLSIFGNDYDLKDGTPIRDYIHVVDLAKGHIAALQYLHGPQLQQGLFREWNLGTGVGSTVFDVYHAFCKAVGRELPYEVASRRGGDVLNLTANPERANRELQWHTTLSIDDACRDLWRWTTENPMGFKLENYQWKRWGQEFANRLHTATVGRTTLAVMNLGATVQSLVHDGHAYAISLGLEEQYLQQESYVGATIGRYANRLRIPPKIILHGGDFRFDRRMFLGPVVREDAGSIYLQFVLLDKASSDFAGDLHSVVTYKVSDGSVEVEFEASGTEQTLVNLTNHTYWNVNKSGKIDGTTVQLATDKCLEVNDDLIPTGRVVTKPVTELLDAIDLCFVASEKSPVDTRERDLRQVVEASGTAGRLTVATTEPSFQLYTGDHIDIASIGARGGFCVEPGRFIDAANHEKWKALVTLGKGATYGSRTRFTFHTN